MLLSSAPPSLAHVFICYVSVLRLANTGFVWCLFIPFPSRLHTFYWLCECASPRKLRFCVVLLCSVPFPFLHTFVCLPLWFASQTMMLGSAVFPSPFGILLAYPISVLYGKFLFRVFRLASVGFARCIPFLPCYLYDFFVSFLSAIFPLNGFLFSPFLAVFPLPRVLY